MKILAVDSSSLAATVALWEDDFLIGEYYLNTKLTHSQTIMEMISSLLIQSKIDIKDIDLFSCAVGPGSFTGLRIGIAAIKGMAYGTQKPCIAVSTLEGLAYNLLGFDGYICPVMDARCSQVYTAFFKCENDCIKRINDDEAISIDELCDKLSQYTDKPIYFVGDGAKLCMTNLCDKLDNLHICPSAMMFSKASSIAKIAEKKFKINEVLNCSELIPAYLRLPQAQREREKNN